MYGAIIKIIQLLSIPFILLIMSQIFSVASVASTGIIQYILLHLQAQVKYLHIPTRPSDVIQCVYNFVVCSAMLKTNCSQHVPPSSVDLMVVANLLLDPADVYVLPETAVTYTVFQLKQGHLSTIDLPASQFYLEVGHHTLTEKCTSLMETQGGKRPFLQIMMIVELVAFMSKITQ